MRSITTVFFTILIVSNLSAGEKTCKKCEMIREQNKHRTDNYTFFDDYVKEHPEAKPVKDEKDQKDIKELKDKEFNLQVPQDESEKPKRT